MEILKTVIIAAATGTALISGVLFSTSHRDWGVWLTFVTLVLLGFAGTVWFQKHLREKNDAKEIEAISKFMLQPGSKATPSVDEPRGPISEELKKRASTIYPNETVVIFGSYIASTSETDITVLRLYGQDIIRVKKEKSGGFRVSLDLWSEDGEVYATFDDNQFRQNSNITLPLLRPDLHTLIVQNTKKDTLLKMELLNENCLKISGTFRPKIELGLPLEVDEGAISFGPFEILDGAYLHIRGGELFDFPGNSTNVINEATAVDFFLNSKVKVNSDERGLFLENEKAETCRILSMGSETWATDDQSPLIPIFNIQFNRNYPSGITK